MAALPGVGGFLRVAPSSAEEERSRKRYKSSDSDVARTGDPALEYDLAILLSLKPGSSSQETKYGSLVQSGTLDSSIVGRKPLKSARRRRAPRTGRR